MLLASNPPAILIVNNDLTPAIEATLVRQLRIDQVLDGYVFDDYIAADPNWPDTIRNIQEQRIMVVRDLRETQNREYADVVAFVSRGMFAVEKNNFGPPGLTFQVRKIHWGQICHWIKQKGPACIKSCSSCGCEIGCTVRKELDELNNRVKYCGGCSC